MIGLDAPRRALLNEGGAAEHLHPDEVAIYAGMCAFLVLFAGLMSGLTLGLLSIDKMDLEARTPPGQFFGWRLNAVETASARDVACSA